MESCCRRHLSYQLTPNYLPCRYVSAMDLRSAPPGKSLGGLPRFWAQASYGLLSFVVRVPMLSGITDSGSTTVYQSLLVAGYDMR